MHTCCLFWVTSDLLSRYLVITWLSHAIPKTWTNWNLCGTIKGFWRMTLKFMGMEFMRLDDYIDLSSVDRQSECLLARCIICRKYNVTHKKENGSETLYILILNVSQWGMWKMYVLNFFYRVKTLNPWNKICFLTCLNCFVIVT